MLNARELKEQLKGEIIGQDRAADAVVRAVREYLEFPLASLRAESDGPYRCR
jgi:hypothetical protein